jgi:hypothetical protein
VFDKVSAHTRPSNPAPATRCEYCIIDSTSLLYYVELLGGIGLIDNANTGQAGIQ